LIGLGRPAAAAPVAGLLLQLLLQQLLPQLLLRSFSTYHDADPTPLHWEELRVSQIDSV
jgi:hypothetical protein